jgi:hypothetical protein
LCVRAHWGVLYLDEGQFVQTQTDKYPPSAYYLSYSVAVALVTWWASKFICLWLSRVPLLESGVMFIAQNSLWTYFWHTVFLFVIYRLPDLHYTIQFIIVFSLSALAVFIQVKVLETWILPRISSESAQRDVKALLSC